MTDRLDLVFCGTRRSYPTRDPRPGWQPVMPRSTSLPQPFELTQPAISKHLKVLERAGLVSRSRAAQTRPCHLDPAPLKELSDWVAMYRALWEASFERLDAFLRPPTPRRCALARAGSASAPRALDTGTQEPDNDRKRHGRDDMTAARRTRGSAPAVFEITRVFDAAARPGLDGLERRRPIATLVGAEGLCRRGRCALEFRAGGFFHYAMRFPGAPVMWGRFNYREIVEGERIVWLNSFANENCGIARAPFSELCPLEIENRVDIHGQQADGTIVSLRARPFGELAPERDVLRGPAAVAGAGLRRHLRPTRRHPPREAAAGAIQL